LKKLAIVGAEPLTRSNAPFDDKTFDIWAISNWAAAPWMLRSDAVIELHKPKLYMNHPKDATYWDWLQTTKIPVYMQAVDSRIKSSVEYPLAEIMAMVNVSTNGESAKVLNSSIAYAIALAVHHGYEYIEVYGVEMSNSSEYRSQQPVFMFWVGFAAGMGVELHINCTQALLLQPLYGYEDMLNNEKLHGYINGLKEQLESIKVDELEVKKREYMVEGALLLARQLLDD
jgi:hypothetical protein